MNECLYSVLLKWLLALWLPPYLWRSKGLHSTLTTVIEVIMFTLIFYNCHWKLSAWQEVIMMNQDLIHVLELLHVVRFISYCRWTMSLEIFQSIEGSRRASLEAPHEWYNGWVGASPIVMVFYILWTTNQKQVTHFIDDHLRTSYTCLSPSKGTQDEHHRWKYNLFIGNKVIQF